MYRVTVLIHVPLIQSVICEKLELLILARRMSKFEFFLWCEANEISSETAEI